MMRSMARGQLEKVVKAPVPKPLPKPPICLYNKCKCPFICEKLEVCYGNFEDKTKTKKPSKSFPI
jgi:hypothetical protein